LTAYNRPEAAAEAEAHKNMMGFGHSKTQASLNFPMDLTSQLYSENIVFIELPFRLEMLLLPLLCVVLYVF